MIWSIHIEWVICLLSLLSHRFSHLFFFFLQLIDEIGLLVLCNFPLSSFYGLSWPGNLLGGALFNHQKGSKSFFCAVSGLPTQVLA